MRNYYRVMLGRRSVHADECLRGGFIGADFGIEQDLGGRLPDEWREFNKAFIPIYLAGHPDKTRIGAGLACGALWTIAKGIAKGDIVLCPDGSGSYRAGEVVGDYQYAPGNVLPHRRAVRWLDVAIARSAMSEALQNSTGSIGTVSTITSYATEIERFLGEAPVPVTVVATDPVIEDPLAFAMEKHLEDFLVGNWGQTELSREFAIYEEDGEAVGQQYATDAGPIDILAVSRDRMRLLVVELKRGRASDVVVGQTLRYMGYVKEQIAEPGQTVEGAIIALEDDRKLRWALAAVPNIRFYRYQVSFRLVAA
ncbi:endonuclease NucS domain-containing protein [Rhodanobacter sp. KK11]|jgi:restriction system protein|uniref:endonuclease NucS domain-containing protein n=1 Tax=Rhodanobacter sp. KK11 TaxID=3083255 RepID=UPI002966B93F|nr:endonuclease NucS domain-containing protein [Rhodanobacter sp. KK11]MDW2981866.1 endonuclease NucS [Rhodanobacter sp. KK11]